MTPNGGPCTVRSTRFCQLRHVLRTETRRPWELMRASLPFCVEPLGWENYEQLCAADGPVPGRRLRGGADILQREEDTSLTTSLARPCHSIQNRTTFRGSQPRLAPLVHARVALFTVAQNVPPSLFLSVVVASAPRPRRAATQSLGQTCHQKQEQTPSPCRSRS
ncbi:hypothetical protein LX36DRAFT_185773 [Colletotrichum falcatum]|nr:hypothetical protein LX36DRAFT_185773 [Colletotrichum falcatum]